MSSQINNNRFLLASPSTSVKGPSSQQQQQNSDLYFDPEINQLSVDTDFDSYWEEEARNPHRNRIRIGRQYQATVPPLLKSDQKACSRKLEDLETLSFCPKKSARLSDAELDHYFTIAKSLNLFAELVETRSLLGRDVTIADLNHIRHKEGLSLASVIQPTRSTTNIQPTSMPIPASQPQQQQSTSSSNNQATFSNQQSNQKSLTTTITCDGPSSTNSSSTTSNQAMNENYNLNQPLMKALSHFISLHHPCHHDPECKKLLKDVPLEDESDSSVSITSGNLRQNSSIFSRDAKPGRSRSSLKQAQSSAPIKEEPEEDRSGEVQSPSPQDWTREEVELFSKAIEVCGKNFSSIKKEFLPSKSVRSIVEYYYIGSRDIPENKKKYNQVIEANDVCGSPDKIQANNNGQGGSGGDDGSVANGGKGGVTTPAVESTAASSSRTSTSNTEYSNSNKTNSAPNDGTKQTLSTSSSDIASSKILVKSELKELDNAKSKAKTIDARMSVYNFDEELKEENSPVKFECPRPGAEVKPLKAKPIIPNASLDSEATNSNVGSLKFFMDGQLVLKLNACQDQKEGIDKYHWVQSGDRMMNNVRQKRLTKRADRSLDSAHNGSQSNSVVSSFQDEDSKIDDLSGDEDSKESINSFSNIPQQVNHQHQGPPTPKKLKTKSEAINVQHAQLSSPINYNRLAMNNRIKEKNESLNSGPVINQAAMPWLQANSFAVAAALLGRLPFPPTSGNMIENTAQNNVTSNAPISSKPMDLSLEHNTPKTLSKSASRSRSRPKNA